MMVPERSATETKTTPGGATKNGAGAKAEDISARAGAQISYEDLYKRWENGNWKAYDLDFSEDKKGWESLSEIQRRSALWIYSMFFYGEDAVTDGLSPYIDAAPKEEQKYFLATQQVDEARHAVFFHRFFKEVIGAGDTLADGLAFTEPHLDWGYKGVFGRLETMCQELRTDRSLPKFAQAITLYHLIIEAAMAQPGQHYIEDFFTKAGSMPAFSEGMHNVARDEQRHIGFGVKVLSELLEESDECKAAVNEILREMLPFLTSVFIPPNWDEEYTRCYGFTLEEIFAFGMRSVEMKWKAIGYPFDADATRHLPVRPRHAPQGAGRAPDQAAQGRRSGRAKRARPAHARGAGDLLRHRRPLRRDRRRRPPGHLPVEVRRRRGLAHPHRQRLDQGRARAWPPTPT